MDHSTTHDFYVVWWCGDRGGVRIRFGFLRSFSIKCWTLFVTPLWFVLWSSYYRYYPTRVFPPTPILFRQTPHCKLNLNFSYFLGRYPTPPVPTHPSCKVLLPYSVSSSTSFWNLVLLRIDIFPRLSPQTDLFLLTFRVTVFYNLFIIGIFNP